MSAMVASYSTAAGIPDNQPTSAFQSRVVAQKESIPEKASSLEISFGDILSSNAPKCATTNELLRMVAWIQAESQRSNSFTRHLLTTVYGEAGVASNGPLLEADRLVLLDCLRDLEVPTATSRPEYELIMLRPKHQAEDARRGLCTFFIFFDDRVRVLFWGDWHPQLEVLTADFVCPGITEYAMNLVFPGRKEGWRYHLVRYPGETLEDIARGYNVSTSTLGVYNKCVSDGVILPCFILVIPPEPKKPVADFGCRQTTNEAPGDPPTPTPPR